MFAKTVFARKRPSSAALMASTAAATPPAKNRAEPESLLAVAQSTGSRKIAAGAATMVCFVKIASAAHTPAIHSEFAPRTSKREYW